MTSIRKKKQKRIRRCIAYAFLCTVYVLFHGTAYATEDDGIPDNERLTRLTGTGLYNSATADIFFIPGTESSKKIKNVVRLKFNEEYGNVIPSNFTATVKVKIEYGHASYNENFIDQTLSVSYNKNEGAKYNAKNYFTFEGAEYVRVTVTNNISPTTVGSINIADLLVLENEIKVTRYYTLNTNVSASILPPTINPGADEFKLDWSWPNNTGHTHTQLEWSWLETEMEPEYYVNGTLNPDLLFKNSATRVDLKRGTDFYNIPLLYGGSGRVHYRVRAINIKKDGTRTEGPWQAGATSVFAGHNGDLNWQSTISFAEEGKRKAVIQYFDGSLRSRQTVTKDNSTNTIVVAETFYDGQGRPAVQVLPAPAPKGISTIGYTPGLNLFKGNTLNLPDQTAQQDHAAFFDLQPIATPSSITPELQTANGTARYYSGSNPDLTDPTEPSYNKNIPDAKGYPYTVTRYYPDGTGRIMAQNGVGAEMKMGSGRETKYYYGTAAQEELNGLFGTEVGLASHYFKNMVEDANNQMSVSYVDMHGRTIATALAGNNPDNLTSLDISQYPNQQEQTMHRNLLGNNANVVKGNSLEAINTLLVPYYTLYKFRYDLTPDKMQIESCTGTQLCFDCMYDLEISITDESGDSPPIVKKFNNLNLNADNDCNTPVQLFKNASEVLLANNTVTIDTPLNAGSYIVRKTLTISEVSLQKYKDQLLNPVSGVGICKTEEQIYDSLYAILKTQTNCDVPPAGDACTRCTAMLGDYATYRTGYLQSVPDATESEITAAFNYAKTNCDQLCNNTSQTLASIKDLMIADMMAYSGQYSRTVEDKGNATTMYDKYNIDPATNTAGQDPALAEALLLQHPEYQRYLFSQTLSTSYNWLHTFVNTNDYTAAAQKGYLFTSDPVTLIDPLYVAAPDKKDAMVTKISDVYQGELSMWQVAYGSVKCKGLVDPVNSEKCFSQTDVIIPTTLESLSLEERNEVWIAFRNLYAAERNKDFNAFIAEQRTLPNNDEQDLVNQGYLLRFPRSIDQMAQQFGAQQGTDNEWAWVTAAGAPDLDAFPGGSTPTQVYQGRCSDYIEQWKETLLQCPALQNHANKDQILNEITAAMVLVCQKGASEASPYGAATVAPTTPQDASYRSFEEVVFAKFQEYGIPISDVCNPYVIDNPKPYGTGRRFTDEQIVVVESCHCDQLDKLRNEAAATGKNPNSLTEINQYLQTKYGDTITTALFNEMLENCARLGSTVCKDIVVPGTNCTERVCDVIKYYTLKTPQPLPAMLKCGFDGSKRCADCAYLTDLASQYNTRFAGYPAPVMPTATHELTDAELKNNLLFQRFLNYHTGFNYTWLEYMNAANTAGCNLTASGGNSTAHQTVICGNPKALNDPSGIVEIESPCQNVKNLALAWAHEIFEARQRKLVEDFEAAYKTKCLAVGASENFTVEYQNKEYHYTLYYYDMAGNLVKTVPPKGVRPNFDKTYTDQVNADRIADVPNPRPHVLTTDYRYNSLNQVVAQNSPDANLSKFWYDKLGRLVVSQNAKQADPAESPEGGSTLRYSYTVYDELGRIKEVGQKPQATVMSQTISQDDGVGSGSLLSWINNGVREQVTKTGYDVPYLTSGALPDGLFAGTENEQFNLRNRVSYTTIEAIDDNDDVTHHSATFYSYDIHGNVDKLLQDYKGIPEMAANDKYKRILYDYDLISGKVNKVSYQPATYNSSTSSWDIHPDAFYHEYKYDAENKLTEVWTSRDDIEYERDAAYRYYKHGPLARTVLGQQQVQGIDYMYTLQGWLKGVNPASSVASNNTGCAPGSAEDNLIVQTRETNVLVYTARQSITFDPGFETADGDAFDTNLDPALIACTPTNGGNDPVTAWDESSQVARDAYNFSLNYFPTDYTPIGTNAPNFVDVLTPLGGSAAPLFNGNIAAMTVNIAKLPGANVYNYHYDQLNRLVNMDVYTGLTSTAFTQPTHIDDYKEQIKYDPNGNILTYFRNGTTAGGRQLAMDDMTYQYPRNANGEPINNRLRYVGDISSTYTEDIKPQTALDRTAIFAQNLSEQAATDNYVYDKIGNLVKDGAEDISNIDWNVYGKIEKITQSSGTISYTYDADGNRISKTANGKITVYVRDASGNVMSLYEKTASTALKQTETHLYGSNRLGIVNELTTAATNVSLAGTFGNARFSVFTRGEKVFELTNHLGNVLATVNDKKIGHASNGTIDYYLADVLSANDYAPFGIEMVERKWNNGNYRYGFNGKESDKDMKGDGNAYDFGDRIYDPRIARWLSVDPLQKKYPSESPYIFAGNSPIGAIDVEGKYKYVVHLAYDAQTHTFTFLKIEKKGGLKAKRREIWTKACSNCGSSIVYKYDWHDYMTFNVTVVNKPANDQTAYVFSGLQDRTIGPAKTTTNSNWEGWASFKVSDNRGGIMWTTSGGDGSQGAGVWGDPDAIENIDAFNELKKVWDKNAPPHTDKIVDLTKKIVKAIENISDVPSGYTDTKNKPQDNLQEALDAINKILPPASEIPIPVKPSPVKDEKNLPPSGVVRDPNTGKAYQYNGTRTPDTLYIQSNDGKKPDTIRIIRHQKPKNRLNE